MACVVGWWRGFLDRLLSLALKGTEHLALFSFPAPTAQVGVLFQPSLSGQVTLGTGTAYCHQSDRGRGQTSLTNPGRQADPIRQDGQPQRCRRAGPGLWLPSGPLPATSAPAASCRCSPGASEGEMGGVTRLAAVAAESPPCTPPASPGRTGQSELGREGRECLGGPKTRASRGPLQGSSPGLRERGGWWELTAWGQQAWAASQSGAWQLYHIHACKHTHVYAPPHTHTHTSMLSHSHTHPYTHSHTYAHIQMHTCTHSHTHTHAFTHIQTHTCAHSHAYMLTHTAHTPSSYTHSHVLVRSHT